MTPEKEMDLVEATFIAEGVTEAKDEQEFLAAWQRLIDSGLCWKLQGWFGRTAAALIDAGHCHDPRMTS